MNNKRLVLPLIFVICTLAGMQASTTFTIDGIKYEATSETTVSVIESNERISEYTIPSSITYNNVTYSVTSIGRYAFINHKNLASITLPSSLEEIEEYSFYGCSTLTHIELPNSITDIGMYSFYQCESLQNIKLSKNLTSIPFAAFEECRSLESISIPPSVEVVDNKAFAGCKSLKTVTIEDSKNQLQFNEGQYERAFRDCPLESVYMGRNVVCPGSTESPFEFQENLRNVTVGDSVTEIPHSFLHATPVTSITLPPSIKSIGDYAFDLCDKLDTVKLSDGLETIGYEAFNGCKLISDITIPNSVILIEAGAFGKCYGLKTLNIADGDSALCIKIDYVGVGEQQNFEGSPLSEIYLGRNIKEGFSFKNKNSISTVNLGERMTCIADGLFEGCSGVTTIEIPNSVTQIGAYAFRDCVNLSNIFIGNSVTKIGYEAFENCALQFLSLPNSLKEIGTAAFKNCTKLSTFDLGDSVENISGEAFYGCKSLSLDSLIFPSSLKNIGGEAFYACGNLGVIKLPKNLESIGAKCFGSRLNQKELIIPKSVSYIGGEAFCSSTINNLIFEDSGTKIIFCGDHIHDNSPFYACHIDSLYIGRNIEHYCYTSYGTDCLTNHCFRANPYLKFVEFGKEVTYIHFDMFRECNRLTSIIVPNTITSIGKRAFYGCTQLSDVSISDNVTSIREMAFYKCSSLSNIKWGVSIQRIEKSAFEDCRKLVNVDFNEGLTSIEEKAFAGCSLAKIDLPKTVDKIGILAFSNNGKIESITSHAVPPPSASVDSFDDIVKMNTPLFVIYPQQYQKADCWRDFYNIHAISSGIEDTITDDSLYSDIVDVWDINGKYIYCGVLEDANLEKGIYIVKNQRKTVKVLIQ